MRPILLILFWLALLTGQPVTAQLLRQQVFGSAGEEFLGLLTPVQGGGYIVAGTQQKTPVVSLPDSRLFLARVNAQGDTLWTRALKLSDFDILSLHAICQNAAGQTLVAASGVNSLTSTSSDAILALLNPQGDTLWTHRTSGPTEDSYSNIILGNDGNFVLTANLNTFPQWLKVNAAGQVVAQTNITYDTSDVGNVGSLFKDNSGIGGYWLLNVKGITGQARKLLHLTEAGVVDQTKPLYYERGFWQSIATAGNQNGYLATESNTGKLVRLSAALDTLWTKQLSFTSQNGLISGRPSAAFTHLLPDGNFVVAGGFYYQTGTRVYLSKITPNGQVLRDTVLFRLGGDERIFGLAVAGTSNYVFSGYATQGPLGGSDLFLGIHAHWNVLGTTSPRQHPVRTLQAWPNPLAGGQDALQLRAAQRLAGSLTLHDALGRNVRNWPAAPALAEPGGQQVSLAGVPAGMYLLSGTAANGQRYTARVLRQ